MSATLALVIETLVPETASQRQIQDVTSEVTRAVKQQSPSLQRDLNLLLRVLEWPSFISFLIWTRSSFTQLPRADRERVLLALARSRSGLLRKAFQGLKRLALYFYYASTRQNAKSAESPTLPLTRAAADFECDVCIVGSGAGGGVIAAELSRAGFSVIVLEMAEPFQGDQLIASEAWGMRHLYLGEGRVASRDLSMILAAGSALGGGTAVNWQTSFRTPDDVREEWARRSGLSFFTAGTFGASLDAVIARAHVGTSESAVNRNNDVLRRGCEQLGYRWSVIPRNAHNCDLSQCGHCVYGCRPGGKQSTAVTFLQDAAQAGARILGGCRAEWVMQAGGRATGVQAVTRDNSTVRVHARAVVAAGGGIETPLLLMRSDIRLPALGRHFLLHPSTCIVGFYDEPVRTWEGPPQTIVCEEFAQLNGNYGFRLETVPAHAGLAAFAQPWHGSNAHRELMQDFPHAAVLVALTRDHEGGRIWLGRQGHTLVDYRLGAREQGYLKRGMAEAARVQHAAGARRIVQLHSAPCEWRQGEDFEAFIARINRLPCDRNWAPLFSAHQMGACRMGARPDASVCDGNGEVYGVKGLFIGDASAFPGSSGVNPMITIMALAHHTAQRIKAIVPAS